MRKLIVIILSALALNSQAQSISIDARNISTTVVSGELKMGNPGMKGQEIEVNNSYLTLAGKPILPVMGEIHFSRVAPERWEEMILKMKANGINIIAFYLIWIHHEETEGEFIWSGQYDARRFVELCQKHQVWCYPRLGPWVHGEVRNGGFPDWLMQKEGVRLRSNDKTYLEYAEEWYRQIGKQLQGLYYKDGGPIIGVQLENEYWRGKGGESHIMWLKETAQKYGMDVPMYTITGWRNTSLPMGEVIPLWGGYPAAPWNTDIKPITRNESYLFTKPVNDQSIGNEDSGNGYKPDYTPYPYLTCELGVGNQISEHRRPIIDPIDGVTIALSKVASGSNLPGYYVFTGGLNPRGKYTTFEEDKMESGYWNEYPDISYDFQAAIGESGEFRRSYHKLKPLHYFLNNFGSVLAPMRPVVHDMNDNPDNLQYSFRTDSERGFLFVSNYYRGYEKSTKENVQFQIQLNGEILLIPEKPITIQDSVTFIWAINMPIGDALLKQSTTQPIMKLENKKTTDWYFKSSKGIEANYVFQIEGEYYRFNQVNEGLEHSFELQDSSGTKHRIFTLNDEEAEQLWWFKQGNKSYGFFSSANLTMNANSQLLAHSFSANIKFEALNSKWKQTRKSIPIANIDEMVQIEKFDCFNYAKCLSTVPEKYNTEQSLYNKLFYRELDLTHTAKVRKASIYLLSNAVCGMRIGDRWINQEFKAGELNKIDLTGYLRNVKNNCFIRLPYQEEEQGLVFCIEVEYFNADKRVFFSDSTWTTDEQYKIPAMWEGMARARKAMEIEKLDSFKGMSFTPNYYRISIDDKALHAESYLHLKYTGDKARIYANGQLRVDNFNNQTTWNIHLPTLFTNGSREAFLEIEPSKKDDQIYFDRQPSVIGKVSVDSYSVDEEMYLFNNIVVK